MGSTNCTSWAASLPVVFLIKWWIEGVSPLRCDPGPGRRQFPLPPKGTKERRMGKIDITWQSEREGEGQQPLSAININLLVSHRVECLSVNTGRPSLYFFFRYEMGDLDCLPLGRGLHLLSAAVTRHCSSLSGRLEGEKCWPYASWKIRTRTLRVLMWPAVVVISSAGGKMRFIKGHERHFDIWDDEICFFLKFFVKKEEEKKKKMVQGILPEIDAFPLMWTCIYAVRVWWWVPSPKRHIYDARPRFNKLRLLHVTCVWFVVVFCFYPRFFPPNVQTE